MLTPTVEPNLAQQVQTKIDIVQKQVKKGNHANNKDLELKALQHDKLFAQFEELEVYKRMTVLGNKLQIARKRAMNIADGSYKYTLAVKGEVNSGKSTFINAILGDRILPTSPEAESLYITCVQYDDRYPEPTLFKVQFHQIYDQEGKYFFAHDEDLQPLHIKGSKDVYNYLKQMDKKMRHNLVTNAMQFPESLGQDDVFIIKSRIKWLEKYFSREDLHSLQFVDMPGMLEYGLSKIEEIHTVYKSNPNLGIVYIVDAKQHRSDYVWECLKTRIMADPTSNYIFFNLVDKITNQDVAVHEKNITPILNEKGIDYEKVKKAELPIEGVLQFDELAQLASNEYRDYCLARCEQSPELMEYFNTVFTKDLHAVSFGSARDMLMRNMMENYQMETDPQIKRKIAENFKEFVRDELDKSIVNKLLPYFLEEDPEAVIKQLIKDETKIGTKTKYSDAVSRAMAKKISAHTDHARKWAIKTINDIKDQLIKFEWVILPYFVRESICACGPDLRQEYHIIYPQIEDTFDQHSKSIVTQCEITIFKLRDTYGKKDINIAEKIKLAKGIYEQFANDYASLVGLAERTIEKIMGQVSEFNATYKNAENCLPSVKEDLAKIREYFEIQIKQATYSEILKLVTIALQSIKALQVELHTIGIKVDCSQALDVITETAQRTWSILLRIDVWNTLTLAGIGGAANITGQGALTIPLEEVIGTQTLNKMNEADLLLLGGFEVYRFVKERMEIHKSDRNIEGMVRILDNLKQGIQEMIQINMTAYRAKMQKITHELEEMLMDLEEMAKFVETEIRGRTMEMKCLQQELKNMKI